MRSYRELLKEEIFHNGRIGLLCNQTAFDFVEAEYLFQILAKRNTLQRLFLPEHGLFAELQDQIPLTDETVYKSLGLECDIVSLYGNSESTLVVSRENLLDLDALLIDIQDVGSRYYTFLTTASYIFDTMKAEGIAFPVYVINRLNPAGPFVEGTILPPEYSSFVGRPGIIHRHGLSSGEFFRFIHQTLGCEFPLHILERIGNESVNQPNNECEIPPSPNMPTNLTARVYSGQCLLEGTNLSEGRGTTRPFEIFGAPSLAWIFSKEIPRDILNPGGVLRKLRFIPTFHKYAGEICNGFQIHLTGEPYHSLAHSLKIIRWISENDDSFDWRRGAYEFRSDRPAIELLGGDSTIIDYLYERESWSAVRAKMIESEQSWIESVSRVIGKKGLISNPHL